MLLDNPYLPDHRVRKCIEALIDAGHTVDLYAERNDQFSGNENCGALRIYRSKRPWELTFRKDSISYLDEKKSFIDEIGKKKYHVIHCNDFITLKYGYLVKKKFGIKLIYDAHEYFAGFPSPESEVLFYRKIINRIKRFYRLQGEKIYCRSADKIITVSETIGRFLVKRFRRQDEIIIVRNIPDISPVKQPIDYYRKLGVDSRAFFLIHSGYIRLHCRCWDKILNCLVSLNNMHLLFLGSGSGEDSIIDMARRNGLAHRVHFIGHVPQETMAYYLQGAHVGISILDTRFKHYAHTLPNKFFEYINSGIPQILGKSSTNHEYIKKYKIGIEVDSLDVISISDGLQTLQSEYHKYKKWVIASQKKFIWDLEKKKIIKLYDELN